MAYYYPADRRVRITDGTASATVSAPGTLLDLTQNWRSGGDFKTAPYTEDLGVGGREDDESVYTRRNMNTISDMVVEQDDRPNGPNDAFVMADPRPENNRVIQNQFRNTVTRTMECQVTGIGDGGQAAGVLLYNISLKGSGAILDANF